MLYSRASSPLQSTSFLTNQFPPFTQFDHPSAAPAVTVTHLISVHLLDSIDRRSSTPRNLNSSVINTFLNVLMIYSSVEHYVWTWFYTKIVQLIHCGVSEKCNILFGLSNYFLKTIEDYELLKEILNIH